MYLRSLSGKAFKVFICLIYWNDMFIIPLRKAESVEYYVRITYYSCCVSLRLTWQYFRAWNILFYFVQLSTINEIFLCRFCFCMDGLSINGFDWMIYRGWSICFESVICVSLKLDWTLRISFAFWTPSIRLEKICMCISSEAYGLASELYWPIFVCMVYNTFVYYAMAYWILGFWLIIYSFCAHSYSFDHI
jgi:hypothetical protein